MTMISLVGRIKPLLGIMFVFIVSLVSVSFSFNVNGYEVSIEKDYINVFKLGTNYCNETYVLNLTLQNFSYGYATLSNPTTIFALVGLKPFVARFEDGKLVIYSDDSKVCEGNCYETYSDCYHENALVVVSGTCIYVKEGENIAKGCLPFDVTSLVNTSSIKTVIDSSSDVLENLTKITNDTKTLFSAILDEFYSISPAFAFTIGLVFMRYFNLNAWLSVSTASIVMIVLSLPGLALGLKSAISNILFFALLTILSIVFKVFQEHLNT